MEKWLGEFFSNCRFVKFVGGTFFENSPTNFVQMRRNKAKYSVFGEELLKYLLKSNTEKK